MGDLLNEVMRAYLGRVPVQRGAGGILALQPNAAALGITYDAAAKAMQRVRERVASLEFATPAWPTSIVTTGPPG